MNFIKYSLAKNVSKSGVLIIMWLSGLLSFSSAQELFTEKAPMPTAREALCTALIDGKIYAIGGLKNEESVLSVVEVYDPETNIWDTSKAPMPTARCVMGCTVVDGKIFVIGGSSTGGSSILSTVEMYDPATDTWETKTPLPTARSDVAVEVVNGKIYVIGGSKRTGSLWAGLSTVEEYDPVTDTWTSKVDMPTPRWSMGTCVIDEKIYAIGGNIRYPSISNALEVYDPVTDTWSEKTPMPTRRYSISTCFVDGKIFAFGGWQASGGGSGDPMYKIVEEYDVNSDTWTRKTDMPFTIALLSTETLNGKIYLIGGTNRQHTFHSINTTFEYDYHFDLLSVIEKVYVNRSFVKPGADSVTISAKTKDPAGITLMVEILAPDQTPVDSLQLFDDGNHDDEDAGDSLYANVWLVNSAEEKLYYVDLLVTWVNMDTVPNRLSNITAFTTIGPVVFDSFLYGSSDTVPNPGDNIKIYITLKNNGKTATATDIEAQLVGIEPWVDMIMGTRQFDDIGPGETEQNSTFYILNILDTYPGDTPIPMQINISSHGFVVWSDTFSISAGSTDIQEGGKSGPTQFALYDNYPNPFNPCTTIKYQIPESDFVSIKIFDLLGKEVTTLVNEVQSAGEYSVRWNGKDLASGIYLVQLYTGRFKKTKKLILQK